MINYTNQRNVQNWEKGKHSSATLNYQTWLARIPGKVTSYLIIISSYHYFVTVSKIKLNHYFLLVEGNGSLVKNFKIIFA